jgi:hypothetical protein
LHFHIPIPILYSKFSPQFVHRHVIHFQMVQEADSGHIKFPHTLGCFFGQHVSMACALQVGLKYLDAVIQIWATGCHGRHASQETGAVVLTLRRQNRRKFEAGTNEIQWCFPDEPLTGDRCDYQPSVLRVSCLVLGPHKIPISWEFTRDLLD